MEHRTKLLLIAALALTFLSAGPLQAEKVYRWTAYAIIAASALAGLPLWD